MTKALEIKLNAIEEYQHVKNLKVVAEKYRIHYATLSRWIRNLNKDKILHNRPWNRFSPEVEREVMLLKEARPSLTLKEAQKRLKEKGRSLSLRGIYNIWNRYGLIKRLVDDPYSFFVAETPQAKRYIEFIRYLLKNNRSYETIKTAAKILNTLPGYPAQNDDLLEQIPENLLSLRRRFDKLYNQFLKIPMPEFFRKIRKLRLQFERKNMYYSAIIAGLSETLALHWMRTPEKEISLIEHLKKIKGSLREPILNFLLTFLEATARVELMEIKAARLLTQKAKRLLSHLPYAHFYESVGDLMTFMSDYRTALFYHSRALGLTKYEEAKIRLSYKIAQNLTIMGKHKEAIRYLRNHKVSATDKYQESYTLTRALVNFGSGNLEQSELFIQKTLERAEKEEFRNTIFTAICCLATIKRALGNIEESNQLLRNYLPLMKKYAVKRETTIMEFLLKNKLEKLDILPTIYLLHLIQQAKESLKERDYKKIFAFAKKYGLTGYLHRCLFFVPELVLHHLAKGRDVMLPKSLIQMPMFNKDFPFYELKFLGNTVIYKNHTYLKVPKNPQLNALLIYLALHIREPGCSTDVENIISNFWPKSKNPVLRLYRLLVYIRDILKLPGHFVVIENVGYKRYLVNKGFYIWTDYNYFTIQLAQAKALERAGEWSFARREYLRAFKLFRGEPFKKNFDEWSLNMRFKILNQLETEAINFAKSCIEHGNKNDARKVLQKVLKIIPDSEEINKFLNDIIN